MPDTVEDGPVADVVIGVSVATAPTLGVNGWPYWDGTLTLTPDDPPPPELTADVVKVASPDVVDVTSADAMIAKW